MIVFECIFCKTWIIKNNYLHSYEKHDLAFSFLCEMGCSRIHTPPMDGILEILAGGGVKDSGNPGRRGVKLEKVFCRGQFGR